MECNYQAIFIVGFRHQADEKHILLAVEKERVDLNDNIV